MDRDPTQNTASPDRSQPSPVSSILRQGESIQRYLVGVSALVVPLVPTQGEMIGMVILYRKAEQPFTDEDLSMATMIAPSAARAVARND